MRYQLSTSCRFVASTPIVQKVESSVVYQLSTSCRFVASTPIVQKVESSVVSTFN